MKRMKILTAGILALVLALAVPVSSFADGGGFLANLKKTEQSTTENADDAYEVAQKQLVLKEEKIFSPAYRADVGRVIVPEGWELTVEDLSLGTNSIFLPDAIIATVTSPDGSCQLRYISKRGFMQQYDNLDGFEMWSQDDVYVPNELIQYLDYRTADECCDYMLQKLYEDKYFYLEEDCGFTDDEIAMLQSSSATYESRLYEVYAEGQAEGLDTGEIVGVGSSASKRKYRGTEGEYYVLAFSYGFIVRSSLFFAYTDRCIWTMPAVYILRADSVEEYEELFDVFCAVTTVSQEYADMVSQNGLRLMKEYDLIKNSGGSFTTNGHGGYDDIEDDTIDEGDTYSAVDAWDDYIRGETDYTTGSGDHVKIDYQYDHVFEVDDFMVYATNSTFGPGGGIELDPTPIG